MDRCIRLFGWRGWGLALEYDGLKHSGDEADARYLAHLLRLGILPTGAILPPEQRDVRDLAKKRMQLVRSRTMHILAMENITARQHGARISSNQVKNLTPESIEQMPLPEDVALAVTHARWLAEQSFEQAGDQLAFTEYVLATQDANQRLGRLDQALVQSTGEWRFATVVSALRTLRGIDTVSAIGLVAEIGDIQRFAHPRHLMSYLGLVPSEHSSGNSVRRGGITKTGNARARRLLTEAAWNYRYPARLSKLLNSRQQGQPEAIRHHAWKAQVRLCGRFAHLQRRGVHINKVCIATARELTGFIWAIARMAAMPPSV